MEPRRIAAFAFALAALAGGCGLARDKPEDRAAELKRAARTLVPQGGSVVAERTGDCIELASSPSCATVYFAVPGRTLSARADLVRSAAEGGGWTASGGYEGDAGSGLRFRKDGFTASVALWREARASCGRLSLHDCGTYVDHVQVERR